MSPIKVYGMAVSTCTLRVCAALEELGVPYELVSVDLTKGEHLLPDHLARQPFGKIPVIDDNGLVLFESRAIIRYLARTYGGPSKGAAGLLGSSEREAALVENWLEAESQNYNGPISSVVAERVFKAWFGGKEDPAVTEAKLQELGKVLDVYERVLSSRPYLAGQHFSLADLSHLSYTHYLIHKAGLPDPITSRPHVAAWWDRISSRPVWKKLSAGW